MLPWSVMPMAGWPSATAAATTSSIRAAPSSIENSVWTWRWVKLFPTSGTLRAVHRPVEACGVNYSPVILAPPRPRVEAGESSLARRAAVPTDAPAGLLAGVRGPPSVGSGGYPQVRRVMLGDNQGVRRGSL